jgi:glycosyltransferase involved in cell wall biosynthesis
MNKSKSVVLLEPVSLSSWGSCATIIPNLSASYRKFLGSNVRSVNYSIQSSTFEIHTCAQEIARLRPSHLVFVDHLKHPHDLLVALDCIYGSKKWPILIFHLFGDFTLYTPEWARCEKLLKSKQVQFVCASPRQRDLVSSFITFGSKITSVCPFPVSDDEYNYEPGLREKVRHEKGFSEKTFVMTYTGRLSLQKNVLKMIFSLSKVMGAQKSDWKLILAGSFDDMGSPFFGLRLAPGSYYQGYLKLLKSLPPSIRSRIEWVGALDKKELRALYHGSDLFVSFSTHHDEDYGMSPIEALCCGTPALISDWGGFGGFAIDSSVELLPVRLSGSGPILDGRSLPKKLIAMQNDAQLATANERENRSKTYLRHFGFTGAEESIESLLALKPMPFSGFRSALKSHARLKKQINRRGWMFRAGRLVDTNYFKTYRNYISLREQRP